MRGGITSLKNAQWWTDRWLMRQRSRSDLRNKHGWRCAHCTQFFLQDEAWSLMEKRREIGSFFLFLETSRRTLLCMKQIPAVCGNFFFFDKERGV